MAFEPLVTSVVAGVFLHEHIGPRRWMGFGLGLSGVALLHGVWRSDFHWAGLGASLIFHLLLFVRSALFRHGKTDRTSV
jgi:drug/metabolite transporter (DMT)-like permease